MSLLPPDDDLDLIHTRRYETKVYAVSDAEMLVRGAVSDVKPPGLYVEGDPEPLEMHRMHVELRVSVPALEITAAEVVFEQHPHETCPSITAHYRDLVGLSIARGFTHKVRELFGGPRGCTHTTALLQAMAPAVIQATWSLSIRRSRSQAGQPAGAGPLEDATARYAGIVDTCHVWAEDGDQMLVVQRGERPSPPLQVSERMVAMGRDPADWWGT